MPFSLGFWAAAGAGGGAAAGAYELISTQTLTGTAASVTFSSIPSTYNHLQIRAVARTDRSGSADDLMMLRLNGDTAANYNSHYLYGAGGTPASASSLTDTYIRNNMRVAGATFATSGFAPLILDILDYSATTKYKTVRSFSGLSGTTNEVTLGSGAWRNTAAITTIQFGMYLTSTNFVAGTRFSLYGIKG